ncbi:uncharacterized protein LOC110700764 [Chenopodium quinoa]|uniref:uncharacterized protein LOC110700764 n=1 Tax=Chenopodium quinoa TaxID=63459 RepID=UPI000B7932B4|nr:uncharacterized protein LOC110700764 [Chenopodium quinoa]
MGECMFERIMEKRKDPVFLERSEKAKKNRRGGSLSNPIEPSHFQGSISASKHAKKMAQKAGGVLPTAPEVFLKTHFKEVPGKGKVAANKRAQQISEAYQKKLDESSTQEGSQPDPNQLYWEVVGGRKKGVVKGLGASASLFYTPSSEKGSQSYNPSIASQL